jgi:hypothetical protein
LPRLTISRQRHFDILAKHKRQTTTERWSALPVFFFSDLVFFNGSGGVSTSPDELQ